MATTLERSPTGIKTRPAIIDCDIHKTKRLFFGWLVDKSKGAKTERLAFDKPQLRRRRPVREKPPSPAHDEGLD